MPRDCSPRWLAPVGVARKRSHGAPNTHAPSPQNRPTLLTHSTGKRCSLIHREQRARVEGCQRYTRQVRQATKFQNANCHFKLDGLKTHRCPAPGTQSAPQRATTLRSRKTDGWSGWELKSSGDAKPAAAASCTSSAGDVPSHTARVT